MTMKRMKKCFRKTGLLLVMLLSYVGADAQVADSTAVPADTSVILADTTVLPMATGYDWITYRGNYRDVHRSFSSYHGL